MKVLAVIPARSGSKRIIHKNIKLLAGYPLLSYPIRCAKQVPEIDDVVVATDDHYYKEIAESYGANVIIRPPEISSDISKSEDVLKYVLDALTDQGKAYDYVILMQATNPMLTPTAIQEGLSMIATEQSASLQTYCDHVGFFLDDPDIIERPMSQHRKPRRLETGTFWITRVADFKEHMNRLCEPISYLQLPKSAALDIDTEEDMQIAEAIIEKQVRINEKRYYKERHYSGDYKDYYTPAIDPDGKERDLTSISEMQHKAVIAKDEIAFINELVSHLRADQPKVLDLGCGTGYITTQFDDRYEKHGLEIEDSVTEIVREHVPNLHIGTLEDDTFEDEFFDVVFSFHVLEHVPEPIPFIKNVARIMKTHGKLVLSTPNFDCAAARRYGEKFRMLHDVTHCSLFSDTSLSQLLNDSGFQVDRVDYPYFDTEYFTMENLSKLFDTEQVSPPFYGNIMTIYATKK